MGRLSQLEGITPEEEPFRYQDIHPISGSWDVMGRKGKKKCCLHGDVSWTHVNVHGYISGSCHCHYVFSPSQQTTSQSNQTSHAITPDYVFLILTDSLY